MIAKSNDKGTYIKGYGVLTEGKPYHSPRRSKEVGDEIYQHLLNGKIVILDLSVGEPELRKKISEQIASDIFNKSMATFIQGDFPPNIVVYIEEAHNLIGKEEKLDKTWPRLAKEGAKYRIALVYATQEVSSVHPNILSNTENWFVTHLNNENEIKVLAKFYDFEDFSRSLIRAQDVGFARVKTLSSPFVVPVQIDKFDPDRERQRVAQIHQAEIEKVSQNNQAAIQLLRTWAEEGDEQEQKETWEYLSRNLGKDRTSI
jgi:DNA helicase HerA-like ATPase